MKPFRLAGLLAVLMVLISACGGTTAVASSLELISAQAGADLIADAPTDFQILDIRTPQEFDTGHIADSVNIDFYESDFRSQIEALDRDTTYFVYCNSGNRSGQAMEEFEELGFVEVYDLDGGIQAWASAGLPLER